MSTETPSLISRCHWCRHADSCRHGYDGRGKRIVEGGCIDYEFLDPALRRPFLSERMFGEGGRRLRKKTTVSLDPENVRFIYSSQIPGPNGKPTPHFTRKVHAIIDVWLAKLDGAIPELPPDRRVMTEQACVTILPESMDRILEIVKHYEDSNLNVTQGYVIDYFITLTRKHVEAIRGNGNG